MASAQIYLWDAETEKNQEPGIGSYQAPRQGMANEGEVEMGPVQQIDNNSDGFDYPSVDEIIKVTIMAE